MLRQLLLISILSTALISCKSKAAFNYSEDITKKDKAIAVDIQKTEDKVAAFANTGNWDSISIVSGKMEAIAQRNIDEIDAMKMPSAKGAAEFKAAVMTYFKFIKNIYTKYKEVADAKTDEARQALVTEMQNLVAEKQTVLSNMQVAQRKYASANGFKVE